jgi:hypothetical protein
VQALGRMGKEIAMLVHGAALDSHVGPQRRERLFEARRAVDDDQLRRLQSAPDEIVEQRTPGRLAFPGDYREFRVRPERLNLFMPLPG